MRRAIKDAEQKQRRAYDARLWGGQTCLGLLPRQEKGTVIKTDVTLGGAVHSAGVPDRGSLSSATG